MRQSACSSTARVPGHRVRVRVYAGCVQALCRQQQGKCITKNTECVGAITGCVQEGVYARFTACTGCVHAHYGCVRRYIRGVGTRAHGSCAHALGVRRYAEGCMVGHPAYTGCVRAYPACGQAHEGCVPGCLVRAGTHRVYASMHRNTHERVCRPVNRPTTSVCQLGHDPMEQGPTEPHAGRSTFLLSSGGAGGGYY